ncbi:MAG: FAD-binding oxidoreductase [Chloroflexi bacterium]|nr:FAD-binding oxidoreductase [Chloroflexota bacterium]
MSRIIADVIIVGGGIVGCSAAFHLARRKGTRVLVVEKGPLGSGTTKRSGAFVRAAHAHPAEARLAVESTKFFQRWKEIVGGSCGWTPTGLIVVAPAEHAARLREQTAQLQALGADAQIISRGDVRDLQPAARVDDIALAAHEPSAGFVDPVLATQSLAARAKELGATFKTGTMVKSIRIEYGRVVGIETNIGLIEALNVVLCTSAWTDRLLKPLKAEIGLRAHCAPIAFFDRPADLRAGHCAFEDWTTGALFRPHTFGLTMGALNTPPADDANPDSFDEAVAPAFVADLQQRIAARLPAMANARYARGHTGIYDLTPDDHAVVGRVPGITGLFVAAGFGGIGFALAPAVGACIGELVADGEARTVDVRALEMARFKTRDVLRDA